VDGLTGDEAAVVGDQEQARRRDLVRRALAAKRDARGGRGAARVPLWKRVLRVGGRLVVVDSQLDGGSTPPATQNVRTSPEYAAIGDRLPFLGGRPREQIEALLKVHGLANVASDPLLDLVAAQERRMLEEGHEPTRRNRYVVWGDTAR
jgi:hypothetical protein